MKKTLLSVAAVLAIGVGSASAADVAMYSKAPVAPVIVSPWDVAFGVAIASDYNLRGITQSNHKASLSGYFEPRFNITPDVQVYAGVAGYSLWTGLADAEFDIYGGARWTIGPVSLDGGVVYYDYPGLLAGKNYYEVYVKPSWAVNDLVSIGGNFYYGPSNFGSGFYEYFASITGKLTAPSTWLGNGVGAYLSGEFGTQRYEGGAALVNYNTWNVGVGLTYKAMTADVRYYDTDLTAAQCAIDAGFTNFCSARVIGKLSFDTSLSALK